MIHDKFYIGGCWVTPGVRTRSQVRNPATEEPIGEVLLGNAQDADQAVRAARAAFDGWAATPAPERAAVLLRIHDGLQARAEEIARLVSQEVGTPIALSRMAQAALPITSFGVAAQLLQDFPFHHRIGHSEIVREPIGVVACITPWNYPLHQIAAKVAPALAAGCTVVVKPSEVAPLNAYLLAEVIHAAGLPPGVFNLLTGLGEEVGEALAAHPEVDMVSFTGSTRAGRRVGALASQTIKRVALELGGKSAAIVLEDADFATAIPGVVQACYLNSGQTCSAHTRMLVPKQRYAEAAAIATETANALRMGDPLDESTQLGPLVSDAQRARVRDYIRQGLEEGATLLAGGPEAPPHLLRGYFVRPTVLGNVSPGMTIAREEIFGPVLSILTVEDEDDAVRVANDSVYGLGGGVWSADTARARRVAMRMRTGQVDINGGAFNLLAPFGGYKQSGNGRELGRMGLEEFLEYKALQLPTG